MTNDPTRNLPKLWKHIQYQRAVMRALSLRLPIDVDCPTARAYDFRMKKPPSMYQVYNGLTYLGLHNVFEYPRAKFIREALQEISRRYVREVPGTSIIDPLALRKYIVTFKYYDRLTKGVIRQWKKLPQRAQ